MLIEVGSRVRVFDAGQKLLDDIIAKHDPSQAKDEPGVFAGTVTAIHGDTYVIHCDDTDTSVPYGLTDLTVSRDDA